MLLGNRKPKRIAVFISGGGSTLQALIESDLQKQISLVVSNKKNVAGLLKAKRFGIQTYFFSKDQSYEQLNLELKIRNIELIFLAGFMKIVPSAFLDFWQNKIFNIHPSLLPMYPGLGSFEKSFQAGVEIGVTIHHVTEGVDEGKIAFQQVSSKRRDNGTLTIDDASWQLRRTEQHLLREFIVRKAI